MGENGFVLFCRVNLGGMSVGGQDEDLCLSQNKIAMI